MKKKLLMTFLALAFASARVQAEVAISVAVSQNEVGVGQPFTYQITVSGDQNSPRPQFPQFQDFQVGFNGEGTTIESGSYGFSISKVYTFTLVPVKEGVFTIPPAVLVYKDKTNQSVPVEIKVVPASQAPSQQQQSPADPFEQFFRDPFGARQQAQYNAYLRVVPSRTRVYVNQELILNYKVLYTGNAQPGFGGYEPLATTGFWAEKLPDIRELKVESRQNINNAAYVVIPIDHVALFPLGPGVKVLQPAKLKIGVVDSFGILRQARIIQSDPIEVTVLPLPSGRPAGFNGAVGQYEFSASVDKRTAKQNDAISLKVTVSGRGNIKTINQPVLPDLSSFKIYKSTSSVEVKPQQDFVSGRKIFEYVLIPLQSGKIAIPSFKFVYFDPIREAYRTLSTDPIVMNIQAVSEKEMQSVRLPSEQVDIRMLNRDIRYIMTRSGLRPSVPLYRSVAVRILLALEIAGLLGFLIFKLLYMDRLDSDAGFRRRSLAYVKFRRLLLKLTKDLSAERPRPERIVSEIESLVAGYAADKLNIPGSELTTENLESSLKARGLPDPLVGRYKELLEEVQMLKYAPVKDRGMDNVRRIMADAVRIIEEMEAAKFA